MSEQHEGIITLTQDVWTKIGNPSMLEVCKVMLLPDDYICTGIDEIGQFVHVWLKSISIPVSSHSPLRPVQLEPFYGVEDGKTKLLRIEVHA